MFLVAPASSLLIMPSESTLALTLSMILVPASMASSTEVGRSPQPTQASIVTVSFASSETKMFTTTMSGRMAPTSTEIELPAAPVYDGLAAAQGRLYLACEDGTVRCMGEAK